jgi:tRNA G18 (ribose-2'-O)-methylase SpoU
MSDTIQQRHRPSAPLDRPRELIVVCAPMRSNINLSRIMRAAGCFGVRRLVCCGAAKVVGKIARDSGDVVEVEVHRTLPPVLKRLHDEGYALIGLEQARGSRSIFEFTFPRNTALVVGNERLGIEEDVLASLDQIVEIPVYGPPHAHNAATATALAMYEYCRQYPRG